jgi:hypothetical protein
VIYRVADNGRRVEAVAIEHRFEVYRRVGSEHR